MGKEVSHDEAKQWDYTVNDKQIEELVTLIENDNEITESKREEILEGTGELIRNLQETQRQSEQNNEGVGENGEHDTRGTGQLLRPEVRNSLGHQLGLNQQPTPNQKANQLIDTMSEQQLRQTIDDIQQESADYDIVNNEQGQTDIEKEIEAIRQKAKADGTFMKAPNGKKSNFNERQWLHVRLKSFKDWFGDWENDPANASKVVDENGEPLVVFHNTDNNFTKFSRFRALLGWLAGNALFGKGFYFSNYRGNVLGKVNMSVFLSVINPAVEEMKSGNDGIIHNFGNGRVWYVAKNLPTKSSQLLITLEHSQRPMTTFR